MKRLILIFAILLVALPCWAEEHFVTLNGSGSQNGTINNPWSLANLNTAANWNTAVDTTDNKIGPGDTVYLDGGASGVTYGKITIGGSGSEGHLVYMRPWSYYATGTSHDGLVTLSSTGTDYGVYLSNKHHFIFDGQKTVSDTTKNFFIAHNQKTGFKVLYGAYKVYIKNTTFINNGTWTTSSLSDASDVGINQGGYQVLPANYPAVDIGSNDFNGQSGHCIAIDTTVVASKINAAFNAVLIHNNNVLNYNNDVITWGGLTGISIYDNYFEGVGMGGVDGEHGRETIQAYDGYVLIYNNDFKNCSFVYHTVDDFEVTTGWGTGALTDSTLATDSLSPANGTNSLKVTFGASASSVSEITVRKELSPTQDWRMGGYLQIALKKDADFPVGSCKLEAGENGYDDLTAFYSKSITAPGTSWTYSKIDVSEDTADYTGHGNHNNGSNLHDASTYKDAIRYVQVRCSFENPVDIVNKSIWLDDLSITSGTNSIIMLYDFRESQYGEKYVFNNVFRQDYGRRGAAANGGSCGMVNLAYFTYLDQDHYNKYIFNNTFYGIGSYGIDANEHTTRSGSPSGVIVGHGMYNNIFMNAGGYSVDGAIIGVLGYSLSDTSGDLDVGMGGVASQGWDYNIVWRTDSTYSNHCTVRTTVYHGDNPTAWENFKTACGCMTHGLWADPKINTTGTLQAASPAIGAGKNLYTFLGCSDQTATNPLAAACKDKVGVDRPVSAAWDIGAYQFAGDPTTYNLVVTKAGTGEGYVSSSPVGIVNCGLTGGVCTYAYADDQEVVLTAHPAGGTFEWSGSGCSGTSGTCTVTMSEARAVTCTITAPAPEQFIVTRSYAGTGDGVTAPAAGNESVETGSTATTTQTPGANSTFAGWSGTCGCTGTGACAPTITGNCSIIATWDEDVKYRLYVYDGQGVTVTSNVGNIYCGGGHVYCEADLYSGTAVSLSSICGEGFNSPEYSGNDCSGSSCALEMTTDKYVSVSCNPNPTVVSATINLTGTQISVVFSEIVTGHTGLSLIAPWDVTVTPVYVSGEGTTTLVYSLPRVARNSETIVASYASSDITDATSGALADVSGVSVDNGSADVTPTHVPFFH